MRTRQEEPDAAELVEQMTDKILNEGGTFVSLFENDELYHRREGSTVFRRNGERIVRSYCEKWSPSIGAKCTNHFVAEVVGKVVRKRYRETSEFDSDPYVLNFANGFLDIRTKKWVPAEEIFQKMDPSDVLEESRDMGILDKHRKPQPFMSRVQIPHDYDPDARCPLIMRFLQDVLPDGRDRRVLLEFCAVIVFRSAIFQRALMLIGDGNNGKSTFIALLKFLLGRENVATQSIHDIAHGRFAAAELDGKLANLYPDVSSNEIELTGKLKAIIGGDTISVEKKGRDPVQLDPTLKLVFSCNTLPETSDPTSAWYRRWSLVPFTEDFTGREDKQLVTRQGDGTLQTPEEMSGLINALLKVLDAVLRTGRLTDTQTNEQKSKEWGERANHLAIFVKEGLVVKPDLWMRQSELHPAYVNWCGVRFIPRGTKKFLEGMRKLVPMVDDVGKVAGKSTKVWRGIRLKGASEVGLDGFSPPDSTESTFSTSSIIRGPADMNSGEGITGEVEKVENVEPASGTPPSPAAPSPPSPASSEQAPPPASPGCAACEELTHRVDVARRYSDKTMLSGAQKKLWAHTRAEHGGAKE